MCDIITLSSDDEDLLPPKKKIKPTLILDNLNSHITVIRNPEKQIDDNLSENEIHEVLSDDDVSEIRIIYEKDDKVMPIDDESTKANSYMKDIVEVKDDNNEAYEIINGNNDDYKEGPLDKENMNKISETSETIIDDPPISSMSSKDNKPSNTVLLENFMSICEDSIKNTKFEVLHKKFPILWKYYGICETELGESANFKQMILSNTQKAQKYNSSAVVSFDEIFQYLEQLAETETIEVSSEDLIKLKKLKKTKKKLLQHIKKLEETEVNFSDDENSAYIQLDRYYVRLTKVHQKYCELLNKNPYSGRLTHSKLDFVDSDYNEINRAISKKYRNNNKFPSYVEMETFIRKVAKDQKLEFSEVKIKSESVHCFKKLGELLQHRRRRELYDSHCMHIKDHDDPAKDNPKLNSILTESYEQGQREIEKIVQKYVNKDEQGEKVQSTENESDKSDYVDSEDEGNRENEEEQNNTENIKEIDSE